MGEMLRALSAKDPMADTFNWPEISTPLDSTVSLSLSAYCLVLTLSNCSVPELTVPHLPFLSVLNLPVMHLHFLIHAFYSCFTSSCFTLLLPILYFLICSISNFLFHIPLPIAHLHLPSYSTTSIVSYMYFLFHTPTFYIIPSILSLTCASCSALWLHFHASTIYLTCPLPVLHMPFLFLTSASYAPWSTISPEFNSCQDQGYFSVSHPDHRDTEWDSMEMELWEYTRWP